MESSQKKLLLRNDTDSLKKPGSALLPGIFRQRNRPAVYIILLKKV